jgi:uncharacterized protein (DUF1810 family)
MDDPCYFSRFVVAQEPVLGDVRAELLAGRKRTHWMWFVFPQIAGLGTSAMAQYYAIGSVEEADAYLGHPILGPRLIELTGIVNGIEGRTAYEIFSTPDDMKFHACITLFHFVSPHEGVFATAIDKYFAGAMHRPTTDTIAHEASS